MWEEAPSVSKSTGKAPRLLLLAALAGALLASRQLSAQPLCRPSIFLALPAFGQPVAVMRVLAQAAPVGGVAGMEGPCGSILACALSFRARPFGCPPNRVRPESV